MIYRIHQIALLLVLILIIESGPSHASSVIRAKGAAANTQIQLLITAINHYRSYAGDYPTQIQGLNALFQKPNDLSDIDWAGPYLNKNQILIDPWGNSFVYIYPGVNNSDSFDIYSLGMDGKTHSAGNDSDDINNWTDNNRWKIYYTPKSSSKMRVIAWIVIAITLGLVIRNKIKKSNKSVQ